MLTVACQLNIQWLAQDSLLVAEPELGCPPSEAWQSPPGKAVFKL